MSSFDPTPETSTVPEPSPGLAPTAANDRHPSSARVGTIVWGLVVLALAALIIIARLGILALNGTYVLIGLMIGAGLALVVGGLLSARRRDKESTTGKA